MFCRRYLLQIIARDSANLSASTTVEVQLRQKSKALRFVVNSSPKDVESKREALVAALGKRRHLQMHNILVKSNTQFHGCRKDFFQRGANRGLSRGSQKDSCREGKSGKTSFEPLETKKTTFFA